MRDIARHYDQRYSENPNLFGDPLPIVVQALSYPDLYPARGKVLDAGAGCGRHAVFFAENGFGVEAVDVSEVGLEVIRKRAAERNLPIQVRLADLVTEGVKDWYQAVITTFVYYCLPAEQGFKLLREIQAHTCTNGLNIVAAWLDCGDLWELPGASDCCFFSEGELRSLWYGDWQILQYEEGWRRLVEKKPDGMSAWNMYAYLIARKPPGV